MSVHREHVAEYLVVVCVDLVLDYPVGVCVELDLEYPVGVLC